MAIMKRFILLFSKVMKASTYKIKFKNQQV